MRAKKQVSIGLKTDTLEMLDDYAERVRMTRSAVIEAVMYNFLKKELKRSRENGTEEQ